MRRGSRPRVPRTGRAGPVPCRGETGAVTAELALGIPLLLAVTTALVWLLALGTAQVRVVDASREAARALARGDDPVVAVDVAERIAPPGATVRISVSEGEVRVTTRARVDAPGGLLGGFPGVGVEAQAVALTEDP